jgi:phospholipid/cholesterol/gamma-HCH transport system permease protein
MSAAHILGAPPKKPGVGYKTLASIGASSLSIFEIVGGMTVLFVRILSRLVRLQFDIAEFKRALYKMAVKSLPIVFVVALFTGAIVVIQSAPLVKRVAGAESLLGWGAGFGVLREIGPLLTALTISGRVGANNTAELGTMVVTEQIDALRALAIDPISFLIVPRFLGIIITLFAMVLYADALALVGAAYTGQGFLGVTPRTFYDGLTTLLHFSDVANGLIKSLVFGLMIALSSCHFGLSTSGGAPGVGRAVNAMVVAAAAGIFVVDFLVSFVLG